MDKLCNVFWNPLAGILGYNGSEFGTGSDQKDVLDKDCPGMIIPVYIRAWRDTAKRVHGDMV